MFSVILQSSIPGAEQEETSLLVQQTAACADGKQLKGDTCGQYIYAPVRFKYLSFNDQKGL